MTVTTAVTGFEACNTGRPSPRDRLRDLAEHVGDPWTARQLADAVDELERPRRPGRPKSVGSTAAHQRDEILRTLSRRHYRMGSAVAVARIMREDWRRTSHGAKDLGFLERAMNASTYGGFALILGTDVVVAGLMSHANAVLAKRGEGISDAEREARLAAVDDEIHRLCRDEEWAARQAERYGLEVERRDDAPVELLICDDSELEGA